MSSYILLLLVIIPLIGALFVLSAKSNDNSSKKNIYNVSIWSIVMNIFMVLYIFSKLDETKEELQLIEKYNWLSLPSLDVYLGVDIFSMLLILSLNLSFLISKICLNRDESHSKTLMATEMIFISFLNGYLISADVISFYVFFATISAPLIILVSTYANSHKKNILVRFSIYNLIGELLLLISVILLLQYSKNSVLLNSAGNIRFRGVAEYFVWFGILFAFISRLPIWPFHYWISSIISSIKNPLVFLISNLIPLIGLYGFMRFWPNTVPETISKYAPILEIICVITMLYIALISVSHKDIRYKLFAYSTVYYLLYLIGVFMPTNVLKQNIGYSLFSYILIITVLSFLISHIEEQKKRLNLYSTGGILCYMPRVSKCISLFILAGIGLPITPLFWNNFIIVSEIFNNSLILGILVVLSLFIVAIALFEELYKQKDKSYATTSCILSVDLPNSQFFTFIICLLILFFSFFKPLWFIF